MSNEFFMALGIVLIFSIASIMLFSSSLSGSRQTPGGLLPQRHFRTFADGAIICFGPNRCFDPDQLTSNGSAEWSAYVTPSWHNNEEAPGPFGNCCDQTCKMVRKCTNSRGEEHLFVKYILPFFKVDVGHDGVFLELGGFDGIYETNSLFLERCGHWRGIMIEAHPTNFAQMVLNRPGVVAIGSAICDEHKKFNFDEYPSPSASSRSSSAQHCQVPCGPLRDYLKLLEVNHIEFLSLDVEGAELEVLSSIDWEFLSISAMVLEELDKDEEKNQEVRDFLQAQNMTMVFQQYSQSEVRATYFANPNFVDIDHVKTHWEQTPQPAESQFASSVLGFSEQKCRMVYPAGWPASFSQGCKTMKAATRLADLKAAKSKIA